MDNHQKSAGGSAGAAAQVEEATVVAPVPDVAGSVVTQPVSTDGADVATSQPIENAGGVASNAVEKTTTPNAEPTTS